MKQIIYNQHALQHLLPCPRPLRCSSKPLTDRSGVKIDAYLRPEAFLGDLGVDESLMPPGRGVRGGSKRRLTGVDSDDFFCLGGGHGLGRRQVG